VSALAAALVIAVQLPALHWFYLYIPWFFGLVVIAVLGRAPGPLGEAATVPATGAVAGASDSGELIAAGGDPTEIGTLLLQVHQLEGAAATVQAAHTKAATAGERASSGQARARVESGRSLTGR